MTVQLRSLNRRYDSLPELQRLLTAILLAFLPVILAMSSGNRLLVVLGYVYAVLLVVVRAFDRFSYSVDE